MLLNVTFAVNTSNFYGFIEHNKQNPGKIHTEVYSNDFTLHSPLIITPPPQKIWPILVFYPFYLLYSLNGNELFMTEFSNCLWGGRFNKLKL